MNAPLRDRAVGRWLSILPIVGVDAKYLTGKHGPCPMCGGKDRWRFDNKNGSGSWYCTGCGAGNGIDLVMKANGCDFAGAATMIEQYIGKSEVDERPRSQGQKADPREQKNRIWTEAKPVTADDEVGIYLAARGISLPEYPMALRFHPSLKYQDHEGNTFGPKSSHPAMIAKVSAADGSPLTLQRIYLGKGGAKAAVPSPRKLMGAGAAMRGAAVRLTPISRVLGVAEGVETALSAAILFETPCWAVISTALMVTWEPPPEVEEVWIFADNDEHLAGLAAASHLAQRLSKGRRVHVTFPLTPGEDWNDVLKRDGPLAVKEKRA